MVLDDPSDIDKFEDGSILVTDRTDPDWVPIMKRAAGIITDYGGRTSHAAIVSRELGLPAIVGSGDATDLIEDEQEITISCAEGDEGDDAVTTVIGNLIKTARANNTEVGICGQAPSDYPEFAEFLVKSGIDSISLNPDSVIDTKFMIAELERKIESK